MTTLNQYRDFFQSQGFTTSTYVNGDDDKQWWVLELKFEGELKHAFCFDYVTETILEWK